MFRPLDTGYSSPMLGAPLIAEAIELGPGIARNAVFVS